VRVVSSESPFTGSVCARCPRVLGASCCEVAGDEGLATLTWVDVRRISAWLRRPAARFLEVEWLEEGEARDYEARRLLYRGYFRAGPRRLTLKRVAGPERSHCVFLRPGQGCSLPADVRPTACRLYPFEQLPDGRWSLQVGRYGGPEAARGATDACLAVEESKDMGDLLRLFGVTREDVENLGAQLAREVEEHAVLTREGAGS
jgi:uncharacterized protein